MDQDQSNPKSNDLVPDFSETIVVPPVGSTPQEASVPEQPEVKPENNPLIPQAVNETAPTPTPPPSPGKNPFAKLKPLIFIGLIVLILAFLGKMILGRVNTNKQVTLTYWGLWETEAVMRPVITSFESSHPNIKVDYLSQSARQYRERLQAAINRGDGPDVFRFHNTWLPMLKNELAAAPEKSITSTEINANYYPVVSQDLVKNSSVYGVPLMIDGLGLYYNQDIFSQVGVKPPTTWPELLELIPKLTAKNDKEIVTSAIALGTTNNVEHYSDIVAVMLMQNGANLSLPTGKEAEETLIFYRKFADPADPVYTWNETLDNSIVAFANGKVAMILAPSWRAFEIKQINPELKFQIMPIPQLPGTSITWASYWAEGVSSKSKYQAQAWEFVKFLTSSTSATELFTEASKLRLFGEPYALKDLGNSLLGDPYVGPYLSQAANAKSFPLASRTFDNGINDRLIKYLEDALNGLAKGSSPQAVLETMGAGFRQILGSYGFSP